MGFYIVEALLQFQQNTFNNYKVNNTSCFNIRRRPNFIDMGMWFASYFSVLSDILTSEGTAESRETANFQAEIIAHFKKL